MKKLRKIVLKIVIIYVIFYVVLGSTCNSFAAQKFDEKMGQYVADYAINFINELQASGKKTNYNVDSNPPFWDSNGRFNVCCTTGVALMYKNALGINLYELGFSSTSSVGIDQMGNSPQWQQVNPNDIKPGDILMRDGHTEMYVGFYDGKNRNANFGSSPNDDCVKLVGGPRYGTEFTNVFRLSSNLSVDPSGRVTLTGTGIGSSGGNGSLGSREIKQGDFFFNGVPDGQYSVANKKNIFTIFIDKIKELLSYIGGLIMYVFTGFFVFLTSIFDRLINNSFYAAELNESVPLESSGVNATTADDPIKLHRFVTIEGIIYNYIDIFDINIFQNN